jgi:ABC-type branched-subunit amino acid transport system substrate-binding protein
MQVGARIYFAGAFMLLACSSTDQGSGTPGPSTPPNDAPIDQGSGPADSGGCTTNAACTESATAAAKAAGTLIDGGGGVMPAICLRSEGRCVELLTEDCNHITGDYRDDDAIFIGTLLSTVGVQSATNLQRQQAAALAVEQINAVGGIPPAVAGGMARPLVSVSCDEVKNLMRAAKHLVEDLHVPAIVGPNTSQDTLDLSNGLTIQSGTVLVTPTAVASSITDLDDNDLTWLMVPSDRQRGKLMMNQVNQIETELKTGVKTTVRLAIGYRNDALGLGTMRSLEEMVINGKPLSDPLNSGPGGNVIRDAYDEMATEQNALVTRYVDFLPDVIVLAGTAEAVTQIVNPLEQRWPMGTARPSYVLIDSVKVPDLITAASNVDLRRRIRGTGVRPGPDSQSVATAFELDFLAKFGMRPTASGVGPTYDATYAIAYALAASRNLPVKGESVAKGLRKLSGGAMTVTVGSGSLAAAFTRLGAGESITAIGTFVPFAWDARGAIEGGVIEVWCVGAPGGSAAYMSSGLLYDVKTGAFSGTYKSCNP